MLPVPPGIPESLHLDDDVYIRGWQFTLYQILDHRMGKMGFEFQPAKQLTGFSAEFLRVTYHESVAYQYLSHVIAAITTGPLQSKPNLDVCSNATSLLAQVQTLWRRGCDQRALLAITESLRVRLSRVSLAVPGSDSIRKRMIDTPEKSTY